MYIILATIFFATVIAGVALFGTLLRLGSNNRNWRHFAFVYLGWLSLYALFILFGTGPTGDRMMSPSSSPYKLPWKAGDTRFVSQGNRSFTSHRGSHQDAWDFWMPIGTDVHAARAGKIIRIEQEFSGIGLDSNYVLIQHEDKSLAMYAHIEKHGALVNVGDQIRQGQVIARSGMVGQTINPHLHFVVMNESETASLPITFADVEEGVPLAGHYYISRNSGQ